MTAVRALWWSLAGIVVVVAIFVGISLAWSTYKGEPLPLADHCTAAVKGATATIDPEQARNAAIISGVSVKRGLKPRAASIALATAFQESDIRNLDYGHSDSLGLFQQRPSQGWGTAKQVMDPWYSSKQFYRALVKVKKWQTRDLNDVAQAVQRSAYPEAYRKHVDRARILASSLTGQTPASFTCVVNNPAAADPDGMKTFLTKTLGGTISVSTTKDGLTVTTKRPQDAWAVANEAIAAGGDYGLSTVQVGDATWTHSTTQEAQWSSTAPSAATEVHLGFGTATR